MLGVRGRFVIFRYLCNGIHPTVYSSIEKKNAKFATFINPKQVACISERKEYMLCLSENLEIFPRLFHAVLWHFVCGLHTDREREREREIHPGTIVEP